MLRLVRNTKTDGLDRFLEGTTNEFDRKRQDRFGGLLFYGSLLAGVVALGLVVFGIAMIVASKHEATIEAPVRTVAPPPIVHAAPVPLELIVHAAPAPLGSIMHVEPAPSELILREKIKRWWTARAAHQRPIIVHRQRQWEPQPILDPGCPLSLETVCGKK